MNTAWENQREMFVFEAEMADKSQRYDDVVESMRKVTALCVELNRQEMELLANAYKNTIYARRASCRSLLSIERDELMKGPCACDRALKIIRTYRACIQKELETKCNEMVMMIDGQLLPYSTSAQAKVLYYKIKGDSYRYMAEFSWDGRTNLKADDSLKAYMTGLELGKRELTTTHPTLLGLALNCSVLYYEVLKLPETAFKLAETAFDTAVSDLNILPEEHFKDTITLLQLLKDNLTLWTVDLESAGGDIQKHRARIDAGNNNSN